MKLWIARDDDNALFLYDEKPIKRKHRFTLKWFSHAFKIKSQHFPEVTFENSPQEVELKLTNQ